MMFLCGIPWNISGYEGHFTLLTLSKCFTTFILFSAHCTSFIGFLLTLCTGNVYWKVSPVLSLQSDRGCGGSEPRTSLDAILDTEVIKYFIIVSRQRKILSSRLLTKKIWESHFQWLKNSWKLTQVPSVSYLVSYMKIYNFMHSAWHSREWN
jgi:hypothetical protein